MHVPTRRPAVVEVVRDPVGERPQRHAGVVPGRLRLGRAGQLAQLADERALVLEELPRRARLAVIERHVETDGGGVVEPVLGELGAGCPRSGRRGGSGEARCWPSADRSSPTVRIGRERCDATGRRRQGCGWRFSVARGSPTQPHRPTTKSVTRNATAPTMVIVMPTDRVAGPIEHDAGDHDGDRGDHDERPEAGVHAGPPVAVMAGPAGRRALLHVGHRPHERTHHVHRGQRSRPVQTPRLSAAAGSGRRRAGRGDTTRPRHGPRPP